MVGMRARVLLPAIVATRGNCVMRIVDQRLYAMKLEGVANEPLDAVVAQFDQLVAGARLRK